MPSEVQNESSLAQKSLRRRNGNQLCLSFELRHGNNGFADESLIDSVTDCFDNSRDFVTHDAGLGRTIGIQTLPRENVGKVQAGSFHAHKDLAFSRNRIWPLFVAPFSGMPTAIPAQRKLPW